MNLNLATVVAVGVGAILIYSAVKDQDPRDVVGAAFGQKPKYGKGFNAPPGSGGGAEFPVQGQGNQGVTTFLATDGGPTAPVSSV